MSEPSTPSIDELQKQVETWKAHARKWEDRAKENAAAKTELDELKAASATEATKAQKAIDDLTKRLDEADRQRAETERTALRIRIATEHGIDTTPGEDGAPSMADLLLTGADEAAMTAQAAAIGGSRSTGPKPNPAQGKGASAPVSPKDAAIEALGSFFE
jgi:hypothetical protein